MKYHIIYLAHGEKHFLHETYLSVLSIWKQKSSLDIGISIYSSEPDFFREVFKNSVNIISLSKSQIETWKGAFQFNHRLKIELLLDFTERFKDDHYIFLDSDTFVTRNFDEKLKLIGKNNFLMHFDEGLMNQKRRTHIKKLFQFLSHNKIPDVTLTNELHMWNSGVIGFHYDNKDLLLKILQTTDSLTEKTSSHILEQFSFCYHFQRNGVIFQMHPEIHHYWYCKEMRIHINDFFARNKSLSIEEQIEKIELLNPEKVAIEKWHYKNDGFLKKLIFRMTHFRKWELKKVMID